MKNIRIFLSENFQVLVVKFSIYLNRCVFVMVDPFSHESQSRFSNTNVVISPASVSILLKAKLEQHHENIPI